MDEWSFTEENTIWVGYPQFRAPVKNILGARQLWLSGFGDWRAALPVDNGLQPLETGSWLRASKHAGQGGLKVPRRVGPSFFRGLTPV